MNPYQPTAVLGRIAELSQLALGTYRFNPDRVEEDANGERRIHQGGYGDRQLFELVQNAADELRDPPHRGGRIHVVLTAKDLYCANTGTSITPEGAETILRMGVSRKRGGQIGRFGVGVKSVLSVTRTPQFFSRSGSFGFDAEWSAEEILRAVNDGRSERGLPRLSSVGDTPVLRLARPLDEAHERAIDPILDELLEWATTVVRLPLTEGAATRLGHDIHQASRSGQDSSGREFPHQFPLFSHHVGTILLEDRRSLPIVRREITVEHDGVRHTINETRSGTKARTEHYRVFTVEHPVSDDSRGSAGELHDRGIIDVSWAVPEYTLVRTERGQFRQVPQERGTFWSFFPTKYPTTLSGALNAAWKTNEDRQNLLDSSALNSELLHVAAKLVVDSLPELIAPDDPAAYLPLLPGRTKESPNWACEYLTGEVWKLAAKSPSLPDQDGELRKPMDLRIHPERLSHGALTLWREYPKGPRDWVHHSVDASTIRRGKLNHILDAAPKRQPETVRSWLESLVEDRTAEASAAAIRVLAHMIEHDHAKAENAVREQIDDARNARIILTEDGDFVAPVAGRVYRRSVDDGLHDDLVYIDLRISADPGMLRHLDRIGVRDADAPGRFHSILDQGFEGYDARSWTRFWELLRVAGGTSQVTAIRDRMSETSVTLRVRTMTGDFLPIRDGLLPGPVVPPDGSRDADLTIDTMFHADDLPVLRELGAVDAPRRGYQPSEEQWFERYRTAMYEAYCEELDPTARRVQPHTLRFEGSPMAGPLHLFGRLSDEGKAAFLAAVPDDGLVTYWTRQVGGQASTRVAVPSPIRWLISGEGTVNTSLGLVPVSAAVGPQLHSYAKVLPVADIRTGLAVKLGLPAKVEDVESERWSDLLTMAKESTDDAFVGRTYALLARVALDLLNEESTVRCRVGAQWDLRPDGDIAVAFTRDEYDELVREKHPVILVDAADDAEQADFMIREWGMRRVADVIEKKIRFVPSGPATALADEFPALRQRLGGTRVGGLLLQRCIELEEIIRTPSGTRSAPQTSARQVNTALVVDSASPEQVLMQADQLFSWGLGPAGCRAVLDADRRQKDELATRQRKEAVRQAVGIAEKIALLVDEDDLRMGLPNGLVASEIAETGGEPDHLRLAQLAYGAHGDGVLRAHAKDIEKKRFPDAPSQFDGGHTALRFVADLGFPEEFAGVRIPSPPMREEVEGPTAFPALHEYQEMIASRLTGLLGAETPCRAMLSLPTAAGKTRVAAEGVIRWVRESGTPDGPILWIAQTGELCEQAVQSWKFVWGKVGLDRPLVIDRLWHTNSATPVTGRPHLVVATDAKLDKCLGTPEYAWLRNASLVLVDEAHTAYNTEYTRILEHLGLTHRATPRHLVGLTATPYRSNKEETRLLVQRFGDRRLDEGVFPDEPVKHLQSLGVLARVQHRELAGTSLILSQHELETVEQFSGFLPKGAEQRLGEDETRNKILIDEITALPTDWPVLVFATSVQHAKFLAAKLSDRGVQAAAIDSATAPSERRQKVAAFRNGRLRVITNYGVLSQGFDAPATRAVVIARPVYSAVSYQQMIGRGLRGPRNGGKAECLILDVRDNITNYRDGLAFKDLEKLWTEGNRR
ncbi:sacsin N-terminal ATP-binding-like domain-containing protein [Catellatospora bangladeshensis]|uniref:sacsin N-terminal ATP-binding-like domain-containing protein n=2 Tax=Catellatospora bangladeshensis TaxID=310355 RepID=UPI001941705E|nr:helicase-related protein [Catellatospora bangladeshensis]